MTILKCKTVGAGYEGFFTVDKTYPADSDFCVTDNTSEGVDDFTWDLEPDGITVRAVCCDEDSAIVATFEIVEE